MTKLCNKMQFNYTKYWSLKHLDKKYQYTIANFDKEYIPKSFKNQAI